MLSCCNGEEEKKGQKNNELDLSKDEKEQLKNLGEYFNNNEYENDNPDNINNKLTLFVNKLEKEKDKHEVVDAKTIENVLKAANAVGWKQSEGIKWYNTGWGRFLLYILTAGTVATLSTTSIGLLGELINFAWPELFSETFIGTVLGLSFLDRIREWFFSTDKDNNNVNLQNNDNKKEGQEEKHELDVNRLVCHAPDSIEILADEKKVKEKEQLQEKYNKITNEYKTLFNKFNNEMLKYNEINKKLLTVKNEYDILLNEKEFKSKEQTEIYLKKLQELEEQKNELENEKIKLQEENKDNKYKIGELTKELEELTKKMSLFQKQLDSINEERKNLNVLQEDYNKMMNDYKNLANKNKDEEKKAKELVYRKDQLEKDIEEKKSTIKLLKNNIKKTTEKNDKLIEQSNKVADYYKKTLIDKNNVEFQLKDTKDKFTNMRNNFDLLNNKQLVLKNDIQLLNIEKENLQRDKEVLERTYNIEYKDYQKFVENANKKELELEKYINRLKQEQQRQQSELDEVTNKVDSLKKNKDVLENKKKLLQDDITNLKYEKNILIDKKRKLNIEYTQQNFEYKQLFKSMNFQQNKDKEYERQANNLKNKIESEIKEKEKKLQSLNDRIKNNEKELEDQLKKKEDKLKQFSIVNNSFSVLKSKKSNTKKPSLECNVIRIEEKEPSYSEERMKCLYQKINSMFVNSTTKKTVIIQKNDIQDYCNGLKDLIPDQESIDSIVIHSDQIIEVIRKNCRVECYFPDHDNKTMIYVKPCINRTSTQPSPLKINDHEYTGMYKSDGSLTIRFVFVDDELNSKAGIQKFLESLHLNIGDCANMKIQADCFPGNYANNLCVLECFLTKKNNDSYNYDKKIYNIIQDKLSKEDIENLLDDKVKALYKKLFYNLKLFFNSYKDIILKRYSDINMNFLNSAEFQLMLCKQVIRLLEEGGYLLLKNKRVYLSNKITDKIKNKNEHFSWIGLVTIQRQLDDIFQYSADQNKMLTENNNENNNNITLIKDTVNQPTGSDISSRFKGIFIDIYTSNRLAKQQQRYKNTSYINGKYDYTTIYNSKESSNIKNNKGTEKLNEKKSNNLFA